MSNTNTLSLPSETAIVTSRRISDEERSIMETHAINLKKRLVELDNLVREAPSFKECGHDKILETFWVSNVPNFISSHRAPISDKEVSKVYWGDAIFPGTHPDDVTYDCITINYSGGYWLVGSGMCHRRFPNPSDRTEPCPECHIPWWVGAGWMEPRNIYVEGVLGEGLEELSRLFTTCVRDIVRRKGELSSLNGASKADRAVLPLWTRNRR